MDMDVPDGAASETKILVAIAEIKGYIKNALDQVEALHKVDADHETRIRDIEKQPIPDVMTQERLKALEERRTISPGQLWVGLVGVSGVLASIATVLALLRP
jgi:hypothetical protein